LFHHGAALIVGHGKPVPDFRQGAAAAGTKPAGRIIGADFYAGAFHFPRKVPLLIETEQ